MTTFVADQATDMTTWEFTPGWKGTSHSDTQFVIDQSSTDKEDTFGGTGFGGYDSNGFPTTGTITSLSFAQSGTTLVEMSDFSMSVTDERAFANNQDENGFLNQLFAGDDSFTASSGDDHLLGFGGNDTFFFNGDLTATDQVDGGSGFNTLDLDGDYSAGVTFNANTIANIQEIVLHNDSDYSLTLNDGNVPNFQSLTVDGSDTEGDDTIDGSAIQNGFLTMYGGLGNDTLTGGAQSDYIDGAEGSNTLTGNGGDDTIVAGRGGSNDVTNTMYGGEGNDTLIVHSDFAIMDGGDGDDHFVIDGAEGLLSDALTITDSSGTDTIDLSGTQNGGANLNLASDGEGGGTVDGNVNVVITEGTVIENVVGSRFNDTITGNEADNVLSGENGRDSLDGSDGNDHLYGGKGIDHLYGGNGDDRLGGGGGHDVLEGGAGADTYHFDVLQVRKSDTIVGFDTSEDKIDIHHHVHTVDAMITGTGTLTSLASGLGAHEAVVVDRLHNHGGGNDDAGTHASGGGGGNAGHFYIIVDINGVTGYQAGEDLVISLDHPVNIADLSTTNFI